MSPRVGAIALLHCQIHSFPHCWHWRRPCKQVKGTYYDLPSCGCHCTVKSTLFPPAGIGRVPANKSKERTPISPRVGAIALLPCQSHSLPHCRCWRRPCKRVKGMYIGIPSCGCHCTAKSTLLPTAGIKGIPANKSRECTMISPRVGAIALSKPLFSPLPVLKASLQTSQRNVHWYPLVWVPLH